MKVVIVNKSFVRAVAVVGSVAAVLGASMAHATLDPSVATTLTDIQSDATSLMPLLYAAFGVIGGGFIIFKLVKKGAKGVA